ncbi:MAG: hypothetical protein SGJ11_14360 [Phycisphaerae bacterium]|nr:hypothetical protein [Phycisphaerae bacterium]
MTDPVTDSDQRALAVRELAWAALLGRWIEFAQASVAFPDDDQGGRWKRSVMPFIELQATIWALRELGEIDPRDRPFSRDRADVMVRRASAALSRVWGDVPMPPELAALQDDATVALREAMFAGLVELVWPGPGVLDMPAVEVGAPAGTLALMPPGSLVMPGEPVGWFTEREPIVVEGCVARSVPRPRQVYRQLDAAGFVARDVIAPLEGDIPPGLPMLTPLSIGGERVGRFRIAEAEWRAMQRHAFGTRSVIPVVDQCSSEGDADEP